jgi:hypothetical protein
MQPIIIKPLSKLALKDLQTHVREVRRLFNGKPWSDSEVPKAIRCNRYEWTNLPLLVDHHYDRKFLRLAEKLFGEPVKPSYAFLAMYGDKSLVPGHIDRQQCKFTIDLCISQSNPWPLMVGKSIDDRKGQPYILKDGEALAYSGTDQWHYRKKNRKNQWNNLAFFHFVPIDYTGPLSY